MVITLGKSRPKQGLLKALNEKELLRDHPGQTVEKKRCLGDDVFEITHPLPLDSKTGGERLRRSHPHQLGHFSEVLSSPAATQK